MSAIEIADYERGYPVMEFGLDAVKHVVEQMEPYTQAGVGGSQEYCLVANVVRSLTGADYVEVDFFGRTQEELHGVAVTRHGDLPLVKWSLPEEIAWLARDFDHEYDGYDATREEALEWLKTR